jgi:hypothetical protein
MLGKTLPYREAGEQQPNWSGRVPSTPSGQAISRGSAARSLDALNACRYRAMYASCQSDLRPRSDHWKSVYDLRAVRATSEPRCPSWRNPSSCERRLRRRRAVPLACVALASVVTAVGGCGESADAGSSGGSSAMGVSASVAHVSLHLDVGSFSLESANATIAGTVTPGSRVTVNHQRASVHGHRWSKALALHLGDNRVTVAATLSGRRTARKTITVTREKSSAETEAEAPELSTPQATTPAPPPAEETCTNGTYVNSAGNTVCRPESSPTAPAGATAECEDGTYSFSESRSGTCSHHGGVTRWLE